MIGILVIAHIFLLGSIPKRGDYTYYQFSNRRCGAKRVKNFVTSGRRLYNGVWIVFLFLFTPVIRCNLALRMSLTHSTLNFSEDAPLTGDDSIVNERGDIY